MNTRGIAVLTVLLGLAAWSGCNTTGAPTGAGPDGRLVFDEMALTASFERGTARLRVPLDTRDGANVRGSFEVVLRHVDGTLVDSAETRFILEDGPETLELALLGLPADAELPDLGAYVLTYALRTDRGVSEGLRSLFEVVHKLELQVLSADRHPTDGEGFVRLMARDPVSGQPAAGAAVRVQLGLPDGTRRLVGEGVSDEFGTAGIPIAMPAGFAGEAELIVEIADEQGEDEVSAPVSVEPDARILLTTDKPMYQPGQTMHLRALALDRASRAPMEGAELVIEIADAAGNKVFKELVPVDSFGVASTSFQLATQVNQGAFRVKAIVGAAEVEKEITVERYSLPKFGLSVNLDKPYYGPGDMVNGTVSAQYFFGQSVAGGAVSIEAAYFDVAFNVFAELSGQTNAEGLYAFSFALPAYLTGTSLEQGNALIKLDVSVVDGAEHEQTKSLTTVVAQGELMATLIPESGVLVPGVENVVYVVVSDPMGAPIPATVTIGAQGDEWEVALDESGLGRWRVTPESVPLALNVLVEPLEGEPVSLSQTLSAGGRGDTVLLRTDAALYEVGDTMQVQVLLPQRGERVFVDVIHGGRTVATQTVQVEAGLGEWSFPVDESLTGALQLHAYYLGQDSEFVRDERLVYVQPADALRVTLTPDAGIYAPGDPARVAIMVTDEQGSPKVAALGLNVVDEAVYALQESQPGLLKVYFELEEALTTPRFQFSWPDLAPTSVVEPPEPGGSTEDRGIRAEIAFAAQEGGRGAYGVDVNTHKARTSALQGVLKPLVEAVRASLIEEAGALADAGVLTWENAEDYVLDLEVLDFWGHPYEFAAQDNGEGWTMTTWGPDEQPGTADDVSVAIGRYDMVYGGRQNWDDWDMADGGAGGWGPEAPTAEPGAEEPSSGDSPSIRVRSYFPETLFVDPSVITDASGQASVEFAMADSITSWRMTALANSVEGMLGSATAGMIVFQDFFVDIDFPATLTRGDEVSVPVAVYNYLDVAQTVTLTAQPGSWFELVGGGSVLVPLDPGQVDAVYFDIAVTEVGTHALTVVAQGSAMSDAVRRTVRVEPDGREVIESRSARFHVTAPPEQVVEETVREVFTIPAENIDNAQVLLVKVYPGFFSQCVEGLDGMLQMPSGCLEQTTSSAWPNTLATRYMMETDTITPEIEMKAQQLLSVGYQRVLTYECADGGFNWWEGDNPGNAVLSSLVIQFLSDSAEVTFVDPAVITRTQEWLASVQQSDGAWTEERHLHAGNENLGGSSLRATSYIAWGLAATGYTGPALARALSYIESRIGAESDIYTVAMAANALAVAGRNGSALQGALQRLHEARIEADGGLVYWSPNGDTMVGSWDDVADIETTSLVGLALLNGRSYPADVEGAITWLISKKDPQGNWGYSTQATVLTLKLLVGSLSGDAGATDAEVAVSLGGVEVARRQFNEFNKDVLWQVDLSADAVEGDNEVALVYNGLGNLMYQIVATHYLPYEEQPPSAGPVSIEVDYDRTSVAVDDTITVTVTVTNHDPFQNGMVLVDLGRPPAFTLHTEDLAQARAEGIIAEYETTDRQILVYLDPMAAEVPVVFSYRLTAQYPIAAAAPGSSAAPYYNAADSSQTDPVEIEVE